MHPIKTHTLGIYFISALTSLLGACASVPEVDNIDYACDRGTQFNVVYTKKGVTTMRNGKNGIHRYEIKNIAANITLQDGTLITLPAQKAGSGFAFSNGQYTLSGKDNNASWIVGKMLAERCQINPKVDVMD